MIEKNETNGNGFNSNGGGETRPNRKELIELRRKALNLKQETTGVIALSGGGGNGGLEMLRSLKPDEHPNLNPCFIDADDSDLDKRITAAEDDDNLFEWLIEPKNEAGDTRCEIVPMGSGLTTGGGSGGDPEQGYLAATQPETLGAIQNIVKRSSVNVIVSGLGGGTGTRSINVIAQESADAGVLPLCVVMNPAANEGMRTIYARKSLKQLLKVAPVVVINNQSLFDEPEYARLDHEEAYSRITKISVAPLLKMLVVLLQYVGLINADRNDFNKLCSLGHRLYVGSGTPSGKEESVEEESKHIFEQLISDPFQNRDIIKSAQGVMFIFAGKWTPAHEQAIRQQFMEYVRSEGSGDINEGNTWTGIFNKYPERFVMMITASQVNPAEFEGVIAFDEEAPGRRKSYKKPLAVPVETERVVEEEAVEPAPKPIEKPAIEVPANAVSQNEVAPMNVSAPNGLLGQPMQRPPQERLTANLVYTPETGPTQFLKVTPESKEAWERLTSVNLDALESYEQMQELGKANRLLLQVQIESGNMTVKLPNNFQQFERNRASAMKGEASQIVTA